MRTTSAPLAIDRLGGQDAIDSAFRRATGRDRVESLLELRLRPDNPYAHPIPGEVVPTSNIVLKVVKRKRKRRDADPAYADGPIGEYTVEAVGVVPKTARFRSECLLVRSGPMHTRGDGISSFMGVILCLCRYGRLPVPAGHL